VVAGHDILTPAPLGRRGKYPPVERRHSPPTQCIFSVFRMFFDFFNIILRSAHVYTPQTFVYNPPPYFKFLEITPVAGGGMGRLPACIVYNNYYCKLQNNYRVVPPTLAWGDLQTLLIQNAVIPCNNNE